MRILWFEVTEPQRYRNGSFVIAGWQDSLESIVRTENLELVVAFEDKTGKLKAKKDGAVTYVPISTKMSLAGRIKSHWSRIPLAEILVKKMPPIIEEYKPDLIQVFGTEWPFGLISKYTNIPTVVHIQGSMVPYNNAMFPPGYSLFTQIWYLFPNIKKMLKAVLEYKKSKSREYIEREIWKATKYYMGRTEWDRSLVNIMHKDAAYFHVEEALRPQFTQNEKKWLPTQNKKWTLVSTGCSSFWKGPDVLLKTANILKNSGVDFEWLVAGNMPPELKMVVERKEKQRYRDNNVRFLGFIGADDLKKLLLSSSCYVHTAYIENSPNSICEAQMLGVPIVATNVGGISTLVNGYDNACLVPANDPWQMADGIMEICSRQKDLKEASNESVLVRHSPENIKQQLFACYKQIMGL